VKMLITGAASGIGKATAQLAAGRRWHVIGVDLDPNQWCADVLLRDVSCWQELPYADCYVACAGVKANPTPFEDMTPKEWDRVMDVNLRGVAATCQQAGKNLIEHNKVGGNGGSIIIVGSISGIVANKGFQNAHYNASKAACHQLARSLAVEWAKYHIRVNAVAPGPIETPMSEGLKRNNPNLYREFGGRVPLARWGRPEEVAEAILFLADETKASFITGTTLVVDGGYTAW